MSLDAMVETCENIEKVLEKKKKAQGAIKDKNETVESLQKGKFTFGSVFKNAKGKADSIKEMQREVTDLETDVANFDIMYNLLLKYMATVKLRSYNKNRCRNYMQAMKIFSDSISGNAVRQ